jgi:hypothetical protein
MGVLPPRPKSPFHILTHCVVLSIYALPPCAGRVCLPMDGGLGVAFVPHCYGLQPQQQACKC